MSSSLFEKRFRVNALFFIRYVCPSHVHNLPLQIKQIIFQPDSNVYDKFQGLFEFSLFLCSSQVKQSCIREATAHWHLYTASRCTPWLDEGQFRFKCCFTVDRFQDKAGHQSSRHSQDKLWRKFMSFNSLWPRTISLRSGDEEVVYWSIWVHFHNICFCLVSRLIYDSF